MTRIQQAIDVNAPLHAAYAQLSRFEDYPRFMRGIDAVQQTDDAHLHWSAQVDGETVEWEAEITEQCADQCIAWHNLDGPQNAGKVELQSAEPEKTRILFTLECETGSLLPSTIPDAEAALTEKLEQDLARLKILIETRGGEIGWGAEQVAGIQAHASTQSDLSLSRQEQGEPEPFQVAEEQNFDAQSDQARRVGHPPVNTGTPAKPGDAMTKSLAKPDSER